MSQGVPEKLLKVSVDIAEQGNAQLTRLTVLKKWFERPAHLSAFAVWMALKAISLKGKSTGEAAQLFREAKALLKTMDTLRPALSPDQRETAWALYGRMQAFQNVYRDIRWARIREISNWNLFLVEKSFKILLHPDCAPTYGYKLAADYCQQYNPPYGNGLNGPSGMKVLEIARWMFRIEALEDEAPSPQRARER